MSGRIKKTPHTVANDDVCLDRKKEQERGQKWEKKSDQKFHSVYKG